VKKRDKKEPKLREKAYLATFLFTLKPPSNPEDFLGGDI
jgi:hypothetical protein